MIANNGIKHIEIVNNCWNNKITFYLEILCFFLSGAYTSN
jgi:hypothetical protein